MARLMARLPHTLRAASADVGGLHSPRGPLVHSSLTAPSTGSERPVQHTSHKPHIHLSMGFPKITGH